LGSPARASLVLLLAATVGAGAGYLQTVRGRNDRMAAAYVQAIDPVQMIAGHHH